MNAKELLENYRDLKMAQIVRYDPDVFCDVISLPKFDFPAKTAIGVAMTGAFIDRKQNPNQPYPAEEITKEVISCIEAGATWVHFHARDAQGGNIGDVNEYRKIIKPIRGKYGNNVFIDGCPIFGNNFEAAVGAVTEGLFELGIINSVCTFVGDNVCWLPPPAIKAQCEYFQALGKRVRVAVHDTASIDNIRRFLIRPGLPDYGLLFRESKHLFGHLGGDDGALGSGWY
jgi:hypothetical protein